MNWLLILMVAVVVASSPGVDEVIRNYTFNLTHSFVNPDGKYKSGFLINGMAPGPTIEGDENDWIQVTVNNHLPVAITMHFHGIMQRGTPWADGVPGITQNPIPPEDCFTYLFQLKDQYGFAWYHAHHRGYLTDGLYGAMNIKPKIGRDRPYRKITNNTRELEIIKRAEESPLTLIADDSFKWNMDVVMARMFDYGIDPLCSQSILINGRGRVVCHGNEIFNRLLAKKSSSYRPTFDSMGCMRAENGYDNATDYFGLEVPGYSPPCTPTFTDPYKMESNSSWIYLNVLNGGGQYTKAFSIDGHSMYVISVDGIFVDPIETHILMLPVGSRITVVVKAKMGVFPMRFTLTKSPQYSEGVAYWHSKPELKEGTNCDYEGSPYQGCQENGGFSIIPTKYQDLDGSPLGEYNFSWPIDTKPFEKNAKYNLGMRQADHTFDLYLNRTGMITFSMFKDGTLLPKMNMKTPLLQSLNETFGNWALRDDIHYNDTVDIILNNNNMMGHPIHLHGHLFYVIGFSGSENFYHSNLKEAIENDYKVKENPPLVDVVYVPPGGHAVIRFVADNPGLWILHCHNLGHLIGGMGAVLFEAEDKIPSQIFSV